MKYYIVGGLIGIIIYIIYQKLKRRNGIPGPIPWPIIGNLIEIAWCNYKTPHIAMTQLSKKYGNVFSIQIGTVPAVIICGNEQVKKASLSGNFDNRFEQELYLDHSYGKKIGLFFSETTFWKDTRKLTIHILKKFEFGRKLSMDPLIRQEFDEFIPKFKKLIENNNGQILIDTQFNSPMLGIIWNYISGTRVDKNTTDRFHPLFKKANDTLAQGFSGPLVYFPFLVHYIPGLIGFTKQHDAATELLHFYEGLVQEHKNRRKHSEDPNFIDAFLDAMDNNADSANKIYTDQNLVCIISDICFGGSETSGSMISFAIRFMVQYPHIQQKIRMEIDEIFGKNHDITFKDKAMLKYTDATLLEVYRLSPLGPLLGRRAHSTCQFGPYTILKGTSVILNLHSCHMEKSVWGEDPYNFKPERFLNENMDIVNAEKLILFGSGKRNCFGEQMARSSMFILFCNLIQNFIFEIDPNYGIPNNEIKIGLATSPKPYNILVKCRN